jgi:hypothetical protein
VQKFLRIAQIIGKKTLVFVFLSFYKDGVEAENRSTAMVKRLDIFWPGNPVASFDSYLMTALAVFFLPDEAHGYVEEKSG